MRSADLAAAYAADGFATFRGLLDRGEVADLRAECDRLMADPAVWGDDAPGAQQRSTVEGASVIDRLDPVIDVSPVFAALAGHHRLRQVVESLLGPGARLLKDKLIVKAPGLTGYGLHQDGAYLQAYGTPPDGSLTAAIAIDAAPPAAGPIELVAGCHRRLLTPPGTVADPHESSFPDERFRLATLDPGDAVVFHGLTPHRSAPNRSRSPRRLVLFTFDDGRGPTRDEYYRQRRADASVAMSEKSVTASDGTSAPSSR